MKYKPGYRTSEFWFTLVSFIFSGLYLMGVITDTGQKEELIGNVSHAVESCILIGGQLAILWKYINSRKEVKKSWWETQQPPTIEVVEVVKNDEPISKPDSSPNKSGSNKSRSRKSSSSSKNKPKRSKKSSGN